LNDTTQNDESAFSVGETGVSMTQYVVSIEMAETDAALGIFVVVRMMVLHSILSL
jgi:hypothetical protein